MKPVNTETQARAVELMREGKGRNAIARELKISAGAVSRIARDAGHMFDWSQTEIATRAAQIENASLRESLAKIALLRALDAADAMDAPVQLIHYQAATEHETGGWKTKIIDEPTAGDKRNHATIFGIMVSKAQELTRASSAAGDAGAVSFLESMAHLLHKAAGDISEGEDGDPTVVPENVSKDDLLAEYADVPLDAELDDPNATD